MGVQNGCPKWVSKMGIQNGCPKWVSKNGCSKMGVQKCVSKNVCPKMCVQNKCPKWVSKFGVPKVQKKLEKKVQKKVWKIIIKNYKLRGGRGGWIIVIPMPEAIKFVNGHRQKHFCWISPSQCRKYCNIRRISPCKLFYGRSLVQLFPAINKTRRCDFEPCVQIDTWTRVRTEVIFSIDN
jgi:hypothetical protein